MSAYLIDQDETVLLALAAAKLGIVKNAARAASTLRACNNEALAARYGDRPAALLGVAASIVYMQSTADGMSDEAVRRLAGQFAYQCMEGDVYETHRGAAILRAIIARTGGAA